ncbi:MAG: transposase [Candidatus Omnitrophica bacterium]|nr:transposase [Candidatus Omnitrophota bacterium]
MAMRKKHEPAIKARAALEAIKGEKTAAQIASEYGVHPTQVTQWNSPIRKKIEPSPLSPLFLYFFG